MKNLQIRKLLLLGGLIELICGLLHFTWPFALIQTAEFIDLASSTKDLLMLLFFATGLCLTAFAVLSFYFSKKINSYAACVSVFALSQSILWLFRLIFEFIWPVQAPIFVLQNPSVFIKVGAAFIILIYALAYKLSLSKE